MRAADARAVLIRASKDITVKGSLLGESSVRFGILEFNAGSRSFAALLCTRRATDALTAGGRASQAHGQARCRGALPARRAHTDRQFTVRTFKLEDLNKAVDASHDATGKAVIVFD